MVPGAPNLIGLSLHSTRGARSIAHITTHSTHLTLPLLVRWALSVLCSHSTRTHYFDLIPVHFHLVHLISSPLVTFLQIPHTLDLEWVRLGCASHTTATAQHPLNIHIFKIKKIEAIKNVVAKQSVSLGSRTPRKIRLKRWGIITRGHSISPVSRTSVTTMHDGLA